VSWTKTDSDHNRDDDLAAAEEIGAVGEEGLDETAIDGVEEREPGKLPGDHVISPDFSHELLGRYD